MLGRAVIIAAGTLVLTGAATAQSPEQPAAKSAQAVAKAQQEAKPAAAEPDPLTPKEVEGPPPSAPPAVANPVAEPPPQQAAAAPSPAPDATAEAALADVRRRLASARGRETGGDTADRTALTGFYAADGARLHWTTAQGFTPRANALIEELRKADDWGLRASAFELPTLPSGAITSEARAEAEVRLGIAALRYARHARGGRTDPQSLSKLFDRKPQLYDPRSLIQSITASSAPDSYLRDLHPKHAGFRNLQKALVLARSGPEEQPEAAPQPEAPPQAKEGRGKGKSVARNSAPSTRSETIQRIVANMERWRWMPDDLGAFHVWNNVPEQMTRVYKDGTVVFEERIVVGKPDTATPNFTANMQFVIFQPEWGVPPGIKNNEIGPLLRRASSEGSSWFGGGSGRTPSSVLAKHGLRVSVGGQVVNPDSVNWSSVDINRYNFIQPAGATNVLGVVKFRFPNKHDVYMHDTPQKHLFSASRRAFSHGCMRVQNPVRFAEVLLEHDKGYTSDQVRAMVPRGTTVTLSRQIPVHNVYFTAVADESGKLRTLGDLYGSDSRVASALEGRAVAVASRGEPSTGEPAPPRAKSERQAKQPKRGQSTASASSGNPFAGLFGN